LKITTQSSRKPARRSRIGALLSCATLAFATQAPAQVEGHAVIDQRGAPYLSRHANPTIPATPATSIMAKSQIVEFDAPGAATSVSRACAPYCGTVAFSINDRGVIVGYYTDEHIVPHAFIRTSDGRFTTFDAPGAGLGHHLNEGTVAYAVNDDDTVAGLFEDADLVYHGFVRDHGGGFTTFDVSGAGAGPNQGTFAWGINEKGETAGVYVDAGGAYHAFVRSAGGKATSFDPPGSTFTYVCEETCLNKKGATTGFFSDANGVYHGFFRKPDGEIIAFDAPGAVQQNGYGTFAASIDPNGAVDGYYVAANLVARGFVRIADGTFTTFDAPVSNKAGTYPFSINAFRAATGQTQDNLGFERFRNGSTQVIAAPDAGAGSNFGTRPSVNNIHGAVAGWFSDAAELDHGFVWIP
jgi:hypothetical protein